MTSPRNFHRPGPCRIFKHAPYTTPSITAFPGSWRVIFRNQPMLLLFLFLLLSCTVSASARDSEEEHYQETNVQEETSENTQKILGGSEITTNIPFMVWLHGCSATLVHKDVALTAAHCSQQKTAKVGIRNKNDRDGTNAARIEQMVRHPDFDDNTLDYDVALVKLSGWFQDNQVIRLNRSNSAPAEGDGLTMLGFGGQSNSLQQGTAQFVSPDECHNAWNDFGYEVREDIVLCAYGSNGVNPCHGDSGGPLMDAGIQVGIISAGSGCNGRLPTTYSRISAVADWIEDQICDLSAMPPTSCPSVDAFTVRIDIVLDSFPEDIEWRIQRGSVVGETIARGGSYETENVTESTFVGLEDGIYAFTIEDIGGFSDGLGKTGRYQVVEVNSQGKSVKTIVSGGDFGDFESTLFAIGAPLETKAPSFQPSLRPITDSPSLSDDLPKTDDPTGLPSEEPKENETTKAMEQSTDDETNEPREGPTASPIDERDRRRVEEEYEQRDVPKEASEASQDDTTASPSIAPSISVMPSTVPSISVLPSTVPSMSVAPSTVPTISAMPSDEPTELVEPSAESIPSQFPTPLPTLLPSASPTLSLAPTDAVSESPSSATTESPTASPNESPSPSARATASPTESAIPTIAPTQVQVNSTESPSSFPTNTIQPTASPPTIAPSATDAPTLAPIDASIAPSLLPTTSEPSAIPTVSSEPSVSDIPTSLNFTSSEPSVAPNATPSTSPSLAPTTPQARYLVTVSILISALPEEIAWRVVDFETDVQQFGVRTGWYETAGFSISTLILVSGTWEFILTGTSSNANAIVEFGILDVDSGLIENLGVLNLEDVTDGSNSATAVFSLD